MTDIAFINANHTELARETINSLTTAAYALSLLIDIVPGASIRDNERIAKRATAYFHAANTILREYPELYGEFIETDLFFKLRAVERKWRF